ncbi:MAG: glycosyltransferase family 4 protein [Acidimicrobiia bacterium]
MSRTRVAIDLTPLLGRPTGVGVFATELLRHLVERADAGRPDPLGPLELVGFAVSWRGRGRLADLVPPGVRIARRPMAARPLREAWSRVELPPIELFTGAVDVVHGTNFVVPPARRAARLVTVHDLTPVRFPELCNAHTLAYPRLIERAWRKGAWIHTDSRFVADEVRTWLKVRDADAERVVPVPLGVSAQAHGDPVAGRRAAGAERYVLALGTIEPRKGLVHLVRALDELVELDDAHRSMDRRHPLHLVVAGPDGWGVDAFDRAVAAARHRDRIVRLGWVDDATRADLLAGAAVLAYPSVYEGFGLPPLEAMSVGVPVVCSDAGPLPEVTGDAAVRVPVGDHGALAAALARVLHDDATRDRLAHAGPRRAAHFSWAHCAAELAALYRRLDRRGPAIG